MVFANLLLCMSVTMLIPTLPLWMLYSEGLSAAETGIAMGVFGIGVFLPGCMCSYLVQRYRRNYVCVWSVVVLALSILFPLYLHPVAPSIVMLMRLVQGMAFGLAQMVLASTLIIDTCESFQRTEANHSATWFGRFALSLGPMLGLLIYLLTDIKTVLLIASGCCLGTTCLVMAVHFPFRVPSDHISCFSFDRFLLLKGWPLLLNLVLITIAVGMLFSLPLSVHFYALMMAGFLLALLAQRFVFPDAELKSEAVSGMLLIVSALLIVIYAPDSPMSSPLLGLGLGIIGARFLLFFIKLSRHCQRGTAQSTFLIGWEVGLALGIGAGFLLFEERSSLLLCSLSFAIAALALYVLRVHTWFVSHKNR